MLGELALFVAVGFAAQLIDGAIGMAYGLFASSVLLGLGVPPATASASVHVAEVFTTGASGLVTVLPDGFEWEGRPYWSLSAIARAITGTRWNGWTFFGLQSRRGRA